MRANGKHRRPRTNPFARGLMAMGVGGAVFAVPLATAATADAAPAAHYATAAAALSPVVAAQKGSPTTYTVVAGDTLAKIAAAHNLKGGWKKLYEDNKAIIGSDPSKIRAGLKLTLGEKATPTTTTVTPASAKTYTDNLDGWIKESLDVMAANGIPGTYDGIHRNIMRESSGNPKAINNWDSNAAKGTPSKGLLQVIDPTFQAYHVPGTSMDIYDPVANITAACNYAADRYGSIDNVFGPY
ncbi:transglycosylase SLT domain-containing protein [Streptomyces himalayensis]|uniref:LysM peptidoglycan-binding domain-containing protein n=1 Tax=Streptomyces himalayensis subsp. himalayensis TaxID=2756131 RepID=A0A7W0DW40_9ACTN|nr:LysM peptidoglycan-binding domain-containing protein [Streptomyces himalayensis]MBA2951504.1 LysM peptidoglycan-binding domain-containing protein [Streptomyces himalayensis subsp. himalayensis]